MIGVNMSTSGTNKLGKDGVAVAVLLISCLLGFILPCSAAEPVKTALSATEQMRLGERMYREGILPSGKAMQSVVKGGVAVPGTSFSCASCHLRAGLGSVEGNVVAPPATGAKLYKPYIRPPSLTNNSDRAGQAMHDRTVVQRPAYDRKSLASALRDGIDPAGNVLNDAMPRYPLDDRDMAILISYLESLSSTPSLGASATEFHFATIITDDVSQEDRQALLQPLQEVIAEKNQQLKLYDDFIKFGYSPSIEMKHAFRKASLAVWELKGAPATWGRQLAAYYKSNPVFAVLGGISNSDWRPIHDFCEAEHLPCLFPITDLPVVSATGWYTYYFNKGYAQEGEAAARYLNLMEGSAADTPILQIVQDSPVGRALASGFQASWHELDHPAVTTLTLAAGQLLDHAVLADILKKHKPGVLLLWADAALLPFLPKLAEQLPPAGKIFISSGYLGKKTITLAEAVRERVYITFPYRLTPYVGSEDGVLVAKVPTLTRAKDLGDRRITSRTIGMLKLVTMRGLNLLYDNLYRDHLLDIIGSQMDLIVRDYEYLTFGPGQRYVSSGCYIIQLGPGAEPALLPKSEWVIY